MIPSSPNPRPVSMRASYVFEQSNGDVTKAYYHRLGESGPAGRIAVALFRAQKTSTRAKLYRGRRFKSAAYDVKQWSINELVRELRGVALYPYGWGYDPTQDMNPHVLYVELPQGQVSFHSPVRLDGPDYLSVWDGERASCARILEFCDDVLRAAESKGGS